MRKNVAHYTPPEYSTYLFTVVETHAFIRHAAAIWSDDIRAGFVNWIAANPMAGDVIPGTGGLCARCDGAGLGWVNGAAQG